MIQISRLLARQLRAVFRRLAGRAPASRPVVTMRADDAGLCVRLHRTPIVAEYREAGNFGANSLTLPLEALTDVEGRDGSVSFEAVDLTTVSASWLDRGVPQVKQYHVDDQTPDFPAAADQMTAATLGLMAALADASKSAASESIRYALTNIQLRAKGEVVATDGRQLLVQSGFTFPWKNNLLIPGSSAYGCKELLEAGSVSIGSTKAHVILQVGPWSLFAPIDKQGRYPNVDEVVPKQPVVTRCQLDPADAAFLAAALPRLPGAKDDDAPITIDLDSTVAVRARQEGSPVTEILLTRSTYTGKAVRFRANRQYVARALQLGLHRFEIVSADVPVACRDERRLFVFMPLDKKNAIASTQDAVRISSADIDNTKNRTRTKPVNNTQSEDIPHGEANGHPPSPPKKAGKRDKPTSAKGLIDEAVALRSILRDACVRSNALIAALKKQKRQGRLLRETIASLRQLQQVGA